MHESKMASSGFDAVLERDPYSDNIWQSWIIGPWKLASLNLQAVNDLCGTHYHQILIILSYKLKIPDIWASDMLETFLSIILP